jgi:hypothetical protein
MDEGNLVYVLPKILNVALGIGRIAKACSWACESLLSKKLSSRLCNSESEISSDTDVLLLSFYSGWDGPRSKAIRLASDIQGLRLSQWLLLGMYAKDLSSVLIINDDSMVLWNTCHKWSVLLIFTYSIILTWPNIFYLLEQKRTQMQ